MAKHSRADIADVFGVYKSTVTRAIESGKLFMGEDGLIDDKFIQNQQTLKKWHAKLHAKAPKKAAKAVINTDELDDFDGFKPPTELLVTEMDSLETRKLKAEVAYKEGQVLNYKLRNVKLKGESIPISIADGLIKSLAHHLQNQYKISAQNLLTEIAHQTKMNQENETKFKSRLISEINKAHSNAVKNVEKEIKTLLSDNAIDEDDDEND
jgi:polyhydroxyalkanoate synthesis regulator phasin